MSDAKVSERKMSESGRKMSESEPVPENIITIINEYEFVERVFNSKEKNVICFYVPTCESCKVMVPRVQRVVEENIGKVNLVKVDIDFIKIFALKNNIKHVPMIAIVVNELLEPKMVGIHELDDIRTFVEDYINDAMEGKCYDPILKL
ncbi:hypothetical protein PVAND_017497 [Polypedilum vanderplanki]|uniref:Thioredoxin n=1 Tax=Polypedilum vanderplanki TaxID=319348 RepID=S6BTQ9_POLVA|nr:hypothetical protein PVAND_017497 [Polypedilum vanderplanki]BAN67622.1 thioredoxin [Polypedilum vanderplanki]